MLTTPCSPFRRMLAACLAILVTTLSGLAADTAKKQFDVPAGNAITTLKQVAKQGGREIMFPAATVEGVKTAAVKGELTLLAALDRMLEGTGLFAMQDEKTGALTVGRDPDPNGPRAVPTEHVDRPAPLRNRGKTDDEGQDEAMVLSPFEVSTKRDQGYYGANTMGGTRLNAKLEDLAASITVITKDQMQDFALLDINDIFSYEAGTEGLGNYTDFSTDQNGAVQDNSALSPQSANRIRGLGPANTAFGNFETSGRIPIDPIDIDAVEISRGPNSSIFGIGNVSGTVNSVPSSANLTENRSEVTMRADSNEGFRTTLDLNRVLQRGKLAVRGSFVFQRDGYNLKPSGIDTVRLNGMIKYRPFRWTTLTASFSDYRMHGNRVNQLTPSDGISGWIANGRPVYDPLTGVTTVDGVRQPTSAAVLQGAGGNIMFYVDQGRLDYVTLVRTADAKDPTRNVGSFTFREPAFLTLYANQPMFVTNLPVTDKSIYDWSKHNLAAANYFNTTGQMARVTLDQVFLSSQRQTLTAQLGWFREQVEQFSRVVIGISNPHGNTSSNPLLIDVNSRLLDGRPNPYFLRPFIETLPYTEKIPIERDTYRAQVAYRIDLTREKGWLRWLGRHEITGYGEYKDLTQRRARWRTTIVDPHAWFPEGTARGGNASTGIGSARPLTSNVLSAPYDRIYVGDAIGNNVDYGTSYFPYGDYTFEWGNTNGTNWTSEPIVVGEAIQPGGTGIGGNTWTILKTYGAVMQSHLLNDRVVPTLGWRHDESYTRIGGAPGSPDGINLDYPSFNQWEPDWKRGVGTTSTTGIVIRPLQWLSLSANRSDSFRPANPAQDLFLNRLPNPSGIGKDYGIGLRLLNGKLVVRYNRYITRQLKTPNGPSGTFVSRIRRLDFDVFQEGQPPNLGDPFNLQRLATQWVTSAAAAQGQTLSPDQLLQRVADVMKLPVQYLREPEYTIAAADDTLARGYEFELNYNPTPAWTMKLNVTKQEAVNERVAPDVRQWLSERLAVWPTIIDPTTGKPWYTSVYTSNQSRSASDFVATNITSQINTLYVTEGLSRPQIRQYRANFVTNFRLSGITDNKFLRRFNIGGAVRWEDKGAIGYYGVQQPPALVTDLDVNRPVYDKAHAYFDLLLGYRVKMFSGRVNTRFQINVRNVQESGHLQPVGAFPDGTPYVYRIIEPRLFIFSAKFDL